MPEPANPCSPNTERGRRGRGVRSEEPPPRAGPRIGGNRQFSQSVTMPVPVPMPVPPYRAPLPMYLTRPSMRSRGPQHLPNPIALWFQLIKAAALMPSTRPMVVGLNHHAESKNCRSPSVYSVRSYKLREREKEREREGYTRVSKNATRTRCVLVA